MEKFGVYFEDHSITARRDGKPVEVFSTREEAREKAKRLNKVLSPGEKHYYKMKYRVQKIR